MKKVIYFDESSALDSLDQISVGRSEEVVKSMITKANGFSAAADVGVGAGFFDLFKVGLKANAKGNYERNGSNVITNTLTNTILTSFISVLDDKGNTAENETLEVAKIKDYKLEILPESTTFLKTLAPYIKLFSNIANNDDNNNSTQQNENDPFHIQNIDFGVFDEVLTNAKGYYELLATKGNYRKVVRFNLVGFRNNYKLSDLQKMNLTIFGIVVGECSRESLHFENEFQNANEKSHESVGFDAARAFIDDQGQGYTDDNELEIIDVLLAGVE
ncbi:DUF6414 family protein [Peribacillus simplex]|uniref:DUF6414 family protein n=1 Tax=Peribacillus simplex TaxID=1478 RepID=UPI00298D657D|nr:DUF6414 family protein [Peribacillus simplex]MDW7615169.1 DUF6414 family protein [Peribacillus simplex]